MSSYRKKPIVIEAFRLAIDYIPDWFMDKVTTNEIILRGQYRDLQYCEIKTLEGVMRGDKGDYIIQGVKGEIYPCKPDIFEASYEVATITNTPHTPHPQYDVQGLLEALQTLACLGNDEQWGNSTGNLIAQKALKSYQEGRG